MGRRMFRCGARTSKPALTDFRVPLVGFSIITRESRCFRLRANAHAALLLVHAMAGVCASWYR